MQLHLTVSKQLVEKPRTGEIENGSKQPISTQTSLSQCGNWSAHSLDHSEASRWARHKVASAPERAQRGSAVGRRRRLVVRKVVRIVQSASCGYGEGIERKQLRSREKLR